MKEHNEILEAYKKQAIRVLKDVLNTLHEERYDDIKNCVDEMQYEDNEYIIELIEDRAYDSVDEYGVPCHFNPQYEYSQIELYPYDDGSGFALEYALTTSSELMDLVLQLEFIYTDEGLKSIFQAIDPQ